MRAVERLSALSVGRKSKPGMYADGGGLYLQVTGRGAKSWIFRFMLAKRAREMGLGPLQTVSLARARIAAAECRRQLLAGVDPIEARRADRSAVATAAASMATFQQAAEACAAARRDGWRSKKHAAQWLKSLETYAYPVFGSLPVQQVDVGLVMKALEPIWSKKTVTAGRVRSRIESVLDWAKARGYREGENPARWRGHLANLLSKRSKALSVRHFAALPYSEIGGFMVGLQAVEGAAARALEFAILTATRSGGVRSALWSEIDVARATWVLPAIRTKTGQEHRVPLSAAAINVLEEMRKAAAARGLPAEGLVFPSTKLGRPLADTSLMAALVKAGGNATVHGFRSTFRDWCSEQTNFPREVAEMALAHAIGDKVEAAYRRGDLFEKRRRLMDEWAKFCGTVREAGKVVPIRRANE